MRSLAEMVSVRPVSGALMDYPSVFVDPALGFAVGCVYWSVGRLEGVIDANAHF
jgi:amino acid transporter